MADTETWKDFLQKMDWEGGIEGLLSYGGPDEFPDELRADATVVYEAMNRMNKAIEYKESEIWVDEQ